MLEGVKFKEVLADKGYDTDEIVSLILKSGAKAIIPPKRNRTEQRVYDQKKYKDRNLIERFFNRAKHFRKFATRYDKTISSFSAFVYIVGAYLWLQ